MDYRARFFSPALGRFLQPDSITPGGTQGLNRYAYVFNNPININDPSGHAGECAVLRSAGNVIAAELCERSYSHPEDDLATYVDAGMFQQNWGWGNAKGDGLVDTGFWGDPDYESRGPGRISVAQMNTPYGEEVYDKSGGDRGLGLGLYGLDPTDEDDARAGMARRIIYGLDNVCVAGCSATDKMMVAALAANSDINANNYKSIKNALTGNKYRLSDGQFDWNGFIRGTYKGSQKEHLLEKGGSLSAFFGKFDNAFRKKHPEIDWNSLKWIPKWGTGSFRLSRPMKR